MSPMIKWLRKQKKDSLVLIAYDLHIQNRKLIADIDLLLEEEESPCTCHGDVECEYCTGVEE
jgi:hypothetical protein